MLETLRKELLERLDEDEDEKAQESIRTAKTVSEMLLPLQTCGWALPGALDVLFRVLEPGITRETVNSLLYGWDT